MFPQCDIFYYHFIIHFPDQPDVRIESADTIAISEGQTLTLTCSLILELAW